MTPLGQQRKRLDYTQLQMAALLKTSQSEISKTELGELPPKAERKRWARAYRLTSRKFVRFCEAARWLLPLWKFFVNTPDEIGEITVGANFEVEQVGEIKSA